jgi:hypothetical protein
MVPESQAAKTKIRVRQIKADAIAAILDVLPDKPLGVETKVFIVGEVLEIMSNDHDKRCGLIQGIRRCGAAARVIGFRLDAGVLVAAIQCVEGHRREEIVKE